METGGPTDAVPGALPPEAEGDLRAFMDAVVTMSSEMDIATVLERLVVVACRLTKARYGALGVLGEHGGLSEFVNHGIDAETRARIGHLPRGHGVLGHLIRVPEPLRLLDLAAHPESVGFPRNHPPMRTFLGLPVSARGDVFGNLYLTDKIGPDGEVTEFTSHDEQVVVALGAAAGVAVDHARTYHRAREHERWLEAAAACTQLLTGGVGGGEPAARVLEVVREVAGAPAGGLWTAFVDIPSSLAHLASAAHGPRLVTVTDGSEAGVPGPAWLLAVPLHSADRWVGAAVLGWPWVEGEAGPQIDLGTVAGFAEQVALAFDVAAAHADRGRLAVLEERDRIARDLHDMVIQRLFAVGLSVQGIAQEVPSGQVARRLEVAVDELDETIKDIRSSIFRLAARNRDAGSEFRQRIDLEVVRSRDHLGFLPRLRTEGVTAAVPEEVGEDAVAVVREALSNTSRHAHATSATVDVLVGAELVVHVVDDGVGPPGTLTRLSGLANMQERAVRRGGSMRLEPGPAGGAALTWSVPLPRPKVPGAG